MIRAVERMNRDQKQGGGTRAQKRCIEPQPTVVPYVTRFNVSSEMCNKSKDQWVNVSAFSVP